MDNLSIFCNKIINNIGKANIANVLTISKDINLTDTPVYGKYNFNDFFNCLYESILAALQSNYTIKLSNLLELTNQAINKLNVDVAKSYLLDNFLVSAWEIMNENS